MELRLVLLLSFHAASRGGETKYISWKDAVWDPYLQCLVLTWKELKTVNIGYPMPIVPHEHFQNCPLHALACYALVGGLERGEGEDGEDKIIKRFVREKPESVTKIVSNALPEGYSATSLRRAAITTMKMHPMTNEHDVTERSGHEEHSNNTTFYTHHSPASGFPGGMALCDYDDIRAKLVPAKLLPSEF